MKVDLLKLCDDVLELSGRATPGPWLTKNGYLGDRLIGGTDRISISNSMAYAKFDRVVDAEFSAEARTALPILASALKALLPYVEHRMECCRWEKPDAVLHAEGYIAKCDCGLSSALSEIEGNEPT